MNHNDCFDDSDPQSPPINHSEEVSHGDACHSPATMQFTVKEQSMVPDSLMNSDHSWQSRENSVKQDSIIHYVEDDEQFNRSDIHDYAFIDHESHLKVEESSCHFESNDFHNTIESLRYFCCSTLKKDRERWWVLSSFYTRKVDMYITNHSSCSQEMSRYVMLCIRSFLQTLT